MSETAGEPIDDPRNQRALALRRLAHAATELEAAVGYLRNSDPGSGVIEDTLVIRDKVQEMQRTLDWRQHREQTP
jgi:hypothetical protein